MSSMDQHQHQHQQPTKKSASSFDRTIPVAGDEKPLQFVRRGSLDPADLYAPMYKASSNPSSVVEALMPSSGEIHVEGEMERTLHKTEKHHPDIILNATPSDVGGQDDI